MPKSKEGSILTKMVSLVKKECRQVADAKEAKVMQGYCKTTMPMYGIKKPKRVVIEKKMHKFLQDQSVEVDNPLYNSCVTSLWQLPHREAKYLAIDFALHYKSCIVWENLPLYEGILRASQDIMWWDFVDPIAVNLIGKLALKEKELMEPILREWIDDEGNMWIRRTAILAQLKHKDETNKELLFEMCRKRAFEPEFFIRKAIGWALREYGKTNPEAVVEFLKEEKPNLSGLSYREGSRMLIEKGLMEASK